MPQVSPEQQHQQQRSQTTDDHSGAGAPRDERDIPLVETIAPVVDEVIDIARQHLEDPISVKLRTWQDNTFQIDIRHSYSRPDRYRYHRRTIVRYHSEEEIVEGALLEEDRRVDDTEILHRETLATLTSPVEKMARGCPTDTAPTAGLGDSLRRCGGEGYCSTGRGKRPTAEPVGSGSMSK